MQLRAWIRTGEGRLLAGPHPERARQDAEFLLLHLTGRNRAWLLTHLEDDFAGCNAIRYTALLERRLRGEPMQYIVGQAEFYGLPFRVTPDVLIPRPETEHLVEEVLSLAAILPAAGIVDVGTGSGAIAVALAHALPGARVTSIDLSPSALGVARHNAERNGVSIRFLEGDLLAPVAGETFDFVVSNPPYVAEGDRDTMAVEVREHEPEMALFAGQDGLGVYRRLVPMAFTALNPGGWIALEIGYGQAEALEGLLSGAGFQWVRFVADLQGIPRVALGQRP